MQIGFDCEHYLYQPSNSIQFQVMKRPYDLVVSSPTGRAKCKLCNELIKKGVMRVGVQYLYKNMNQWRCQYYHETCVKSDAGSHILQKLNLDPSLSRKRKQDEITTTTQEDMLNIGAASAQRAERRQQNIIDGRHDLREALQRARMNVATNLDQPAFMVFSNKALDDLVLRMPCSDSELLGVFGFGVTKVRQYGGIFLPIIASYKKRMYGQKSRTSSAAASVSSPQCVAQLNNPRRNLREALRRKRMPVCVTQLKNINDDDDDEVIIESEISIDQMIQRKIRAAQERGEIIELEL